MKENKKGISLVVLVITIIVVSILATVTISTLVNERYFEEADYASFSSSFEAYKDELEDYIGNQEFLNSGRYNRKSLNADKDKIVYDGVENTDQNIKSIIKSLNDKYVNVIVIENGNLKYTGNVEKYKQQFNVN